MSFIQNQFEENFITTSVDYVFNWARKSAIWPLTNRAFAASSTTHFVLRALRASVGRALLIVVDSAISGMFDRMRARIDRIAVRLRPNSWASAFAGCFAPEPTRAFQRFQTSR